MARPLLCFFIASLFFASFVTAPLPMALANTISFFDDFETDEGGDGSLDGDTSTSGHTWGNTIVGIVEGDPAPPTGGTGGDMVVNSSYAWASTNGAGTTDGDWIGNAAQFTKVTSGTLIWSMDVAIGPSAGRLQPILRDTPDASGLANTQNQSSSWFVGPGVINHEGLGGLNGNVATTSLVDGDNIHVKFVYDLDAQMVTGSWFDNNNPGTSGTITPLDYSGKTKLEPNAFDLFANRSAGNAGGVDNVWIADHSIPEPTGLVLLCLGTLALLCRRR